MAERTLNVSIFRYNPNIPGDKPRMQEYELQEMPHMTIFMALNKIREEQDPTLQFDFVCRAGICGSCGMIINGKIRTALIFDAIAAPKNIAKKIMSLSLRR